MNIQNFVHLRLESFRVFNDVEALSHNQTIILITTAIACAIFLSIATMVVYRLLTGRCTQSVVPSKEDKTETAEKFVSCVNDKLFTELPRLNRQEAQSFLSRGGQLNIVTDENTGKEKIPIRQGEQVITGCTSGLNRSQVTAAVLRAMKADVKGVLAGGDSGMNPHADFPSFRDPREDIKGSASNFVSVFGCEKLIQIGATETGQLEDVVEAKQFYKNFINALKKTHFITFGPCGLSVLRRLLEREGSLKGFAITHISWGDEIAHPPGEIVPYSESAYRQFGSKVKDCFRNII